jgi:VWFA-related protein
VNRQFLGLLVAAAALAVVSAQTPPPQAPPAQTIPSQTPPPQTPPPGQRQVFRTGTNFVRVDARVLRDGKLVADLKASEFQILEDGVSQKIDTFEFVRTDRPLGITPIEPSSSAAALDLAADPRNRVFVLFMDTYHVTPENSLQTPMALVRTIDSLIAPTDLVGVMTPEMRVRDLILGRKVDVIRRGLIENRRWGLMFTGCQSRGLLDQTEKMYSVCYPSSNAQCDLSWTAEQLIRRRRESFTLDVLRELVRYIGSTREARTAFLLVSEGWPLFRHDGTLASTGAARPPMIQIGPGGRLGTQNPGDLNVDKELCARHLREAAQRDNYQRFLDLIDDANRHNASFYIVDPGGLRVDRGHVETLQTLAENTNGDAVVNTNDLGGALQNVVDELSGYYLIGYYSSNVKPDGRFRSITVEVARPGVEVRARKGYRAYTADEAASIVAARAATDAPVDPATTAHAAALGRLARLKPDTPFYLNATVDPVLGELHVTGELSAAASRSAEWRQGAEAQILVSTADGTPAGSGRAAIAPGGRAFLARVALGRSTGPTEYEIGVRVKATGGSTSLLETIRASRTSDPIGEVIAFRSAGLQNPVATFLWWRTEQLRFEAPLAADAGVPAGRLLDQAGNPMPVPVDVTVREERGSRWAVAAFKLGALSPADYVVELRSGASRRFVPLRVER